MNDIETNVNTIQTNEIHGNQLNSNKSKSQSLSNSTTPKRTPKWTECGWRADKPFSNVSEQVIAKNVTLTVSIKLHFILFKYKI